MTGELKAMLERFDSLEEIVDSCGKKAFYARIGDKEIYIAESGVGEILAAAATQWLITRFNVEAIINFGVCGALKPRHGLKKTVLVKGVAHYEMDTSALDGTEVGRYVFLPSVIIPTSDELIKKALDVKPSLECVICASGNKFIVEAADKQYLTDLFDADICEMESAGIALTCHSSGVPCLIVKAVSDGEGGADDFRATVEEACRVYTELITNLIPSL